MRAPDAKANHAVAVDPFGGQSRCARVEDVSGLNEEFHASITADFVLRPLDHFFCFFLDVFVRDHDRDVPSDDGQ